MANQLVILFACKITAKNKSIFTCQLKHIPLRTYMRYRNNKEYFRTKNMKTVNTNFKSGNIHSSGITQNQI